MPETIYATDRHAMSRLPPFEVHNTEYPTAEARFALMILERWAMVQGKPEGEDSAGRAKINLMPVDDVVHRACSIADAAFAKFRECGWMLAVPALDDLEAELQERANARENSRGGFLSRKKR